MQERVLGSIIMGGIAVLGVVWAVIEGVPPLVNAKKAEATLESKITEIVKTKYDSNVESLDVKRISFITKDYRQEGSNRPKYKAVISLEGKVNDSEENLFKCSIISSNNYILDLQNKIGTGENAAYISMEYDVYQNYSMTLADLMNTILDDSTTEFESYAVSDGLYSRLYADAGCSINAINQKVDNPNQLEELSVKEAIEKTSDLKYGERLENEVFVTGVVKSIESKKDESTKNIHYTIRLETEGADGLHEFEVYSAKLLYSVKEEDLVVGATVVCKGSLTTNMAYKVVTK